MSLCQHGVQIGHGYECSACVTSPVAVVDPEPPFSPLIGAIFTQMFADSAATTNALIDSLRHRADEDEAELYAIRTGVDRLLSGPYMPNSDAIHRAVFYPDRALIDEYKANKEVGW